ncbi:MAG: hypothetical protein Q7R95_03575 [bacterium]|nr:hypothetical protein [bacterium]
MNNLLNIVTFFILIGSIPRFIFFILKQSIYIIRTLFYFIKSISLYITLIFLGILLGIFSYQILQFSSKQISLFYISKKQKQITIYDKNNILLYRTTLNPPFNKTVQFDISPKIYKRSPVVINTLLQYFNNNFYEIFSNTSTVRIQTSIDAYMTNQIQKQLVGLIPDQQDVYIKVIDKNTNMVVALSEMNSHYPLSEKVLHIINPSSFITSINGNKYRNNTLITDTYKPIQSDCCLIYIFTNNKINVELSTLLTNTINSAYSRTHLQKLVQNGGEINEIKQ